MKKVTYSRNKVIEVLRTLEEIVVSLDRIGSGDHARSKKERDATVSAFITKHDIFRKTAKARRILSEPFSTELGRDGKEELEREMEDVPCWKPQIKR